MALTYKLLVLAVAAQVLLTLLILVRLGMERVPRVVRGEVDAAQVAVDRSGWHPRAQLLSNSFDSHFQLPVLFFVAVLVCLQTGLAGWLEVILACAFVATRCAHAYLHTTTNPLYPRFAVFCAGLAILAVFWLWLVIRLVILTPSI